MKGLLMLVVLILAIGVGLKIAGVPIPLVDYPVGPMGVDTPGPGMRDITIEAPGFGDFPAP